jgi:hypothetical protein
MVHAALIELVHVNGTLRVIVRGRHALDCGSQLSFRAS